MRHTDAGRRTGKLYFRGIETVSSPLRLKCYLRKIASDRSDRIRIGPEPDELRMIPVAHRAAQEDFLGQEPFSPESEESLPIEVAGME